MRGPQLRSCSRFARLHVDLWVRRSCGERNGLPCATWGRETICSPACSRRGRQRLGSADRKRVLLSVLRHNIDDGGRASAGWTSLWPLRTTLWSRATFSKLTYREEGRHWWEWHQLSAHRVAAEAFLTFSNVNTHNHFALCRHGAVHNPHAAILELGSAETEAELVDLLGVLNSSTACFWMKQVFHNKGDSTDKADHTRHRC